MNELFEKHLPAVRRAEIAVYNVLTALEDDFQVLQKEMPDRKCDIENIQMVVDELVKADARIERAASLMKR